VNSRGRRTQRRAAERREEKEQRRKRLELQLSYRPKKRKIKNEEETTMGFFDSVFRGRSDRGEKASKAKTPPMKVQKPVYGDKKMVKAKNPKKKGK
jgi:hypothetical protein